MIEWRILQRSPSLIFDDALVDVLRPGQEGQVVLDHTPFYAESGGQIGDTGLLLSASARFTVRDTQKIGASFAHVGGRRRRASCVSVMPWMRGSTKNAARRLH